MNARSTLLVFFLSPLAGQWIVGAASIPMGITNSKVILSSLTEVVKADIPTLARIANPEGRDGMRSLSGCCHILLVYGRGPTDLSYFTSGELALKALMDEQTAVAAFGKSPFVRTRNGLRYFLSEDPVFNSDVGEAHQDQCLATFAALGIPVEAPIRTGSHSYSIHDLVSESVASFSLDQKELAWTAIAFAKYIPPKTDWTNRFRQRISFSDLAEYLLRRDLNRESCAGTHILQALIQIAQAHSNSPILNRRARQQVDAYLQIKLQELVQLQQSDGSWTKQWCASVHEDLGSVTPFFTKFLVTSHVLEAIQMLGSARELPEAVHLRAREWLRHSLTSPEIRPDGSWLCPFAHATKSLSEVQRVTENNAIINSNTTFHLPSSEVEHGRTGPTVETQSNKKL